jgi:hypothetical protein
MAKNKETIVVYNDRTGEPMEVASKHKENYVGKGYSLKAPKTNTKES